MTEERRYDEKEVAEIFEAATDARANASTRVTAGEGFTLRQLHEIAEEVGIPTELVTRAAQRVGAPRVPATRSWMGVPIGVGRTVELPRALTDPEWHRLVASLRETFAATGRVEVSGELRQWWNGNLRVSVEPTGTGYRLRMTTRKGDLPTMLALGASILTIALILLVVGAVSGTLDASAAAMLGAIGTMVLGGSLGRQPFWARTRARQMDGIVAEVAEMTALPPPRPDRPSDPDPA